MKEKILIFYLHQDFVYKILHFLYPEKISHDMKFPDGKIDILIVNEDSQIEVKTFLGTKEDYKFYNPDKIYIEECLFKECSEKFKNVDKNIKIEIFNLNSL